MGMYGSILDKLDDSLYIKISPGKPAHLRILDHPWISQKQFEDQEVDAPTGEIRTVSRIATQFHWPVWDYAQQRVRILSQGKSVFKQFAEACETWPQGELMPSPFDVVIKRTGTGKNDTEYTVTAVPYSGQMPAIPRTQLPDMYKASGGIPIQQVLEGKTAPVLPPSSKAGALPEPKRVTHEDAARLAAQEAADKALDTQMDATVYGPDQHKPQGTDTVITDVPEGPVNLDDIPDYTDTDAPAPGLDPEPDNPSDLNRPDFLT